MNMHTSRRWSIAATIALAASLLVTTAPPALADHGVVPITVTISRFIEIQDPDPTQGDGDYYARVSIDNQAFQQSGEQSGEDISPFWTFTRDVNTAVSGHNIPVVIEIWDADVFPAGPDDIIDLDPVNNEVQLNLTFDILTQSWSGDVPLNQGFSQGDGDHEHYGASEGGEAGKVFFSITSLSSSGDADGDGLLDAWETNGFDMNGDGTIDVDLPGFGADPLHKDLFLEFDWMTGEEPAQAEIALMKAAFAAAPITAGGTTNPDGLPGINLWVDTGALTDTAGTEDGFAGACGDGIDNGGDGDTDAADSDCLVADDLGGGNAIPASGISRLNSAFYSVKGTNFDSERRWIFRYGLSAQPGTGFGGGWGERGGNDFIEYNHDGGTIMHELGHNLNLAHGGNVSSNCKPNYVSVMNYDNQFGIQQSGGGIILDFSPPRFAGGRGVAPLPSLTENNLNEATILDGTDAANRFIFTDATGAKVQNPLNATVDWNGDGDTADSGLTVNIDDNASGGGPAACDNGSSSSTLNGYDDWTNIALGFRQFGDSSDGAINEVLEPELTLDELLELQEQLDTADVAIAVTDSIDPGVAGTQLTYSVDVENLGPNPSADTVVTNTLPAEVYYVSDDAGCDHAAGTVTCELGELLDGETQTVAITVAVPAALVHDNGAPVTITNSASVSKRGPDPDPSNDDATEDTLIEAVADLEVVSIGATDAPTEILIGDDVDVTIRTVVTNNGHSAPMDGDVDVDASPSAGSGVAPANTTGLEPAIADGELRAVDRVFTMSCNAPGAQQFSFDAAIAPSRVDDSDPVSGNNELSATVDVECVVPVAINVKPGSTRNPIHDDKGTIPLAVLTTEAGEYGLPLAFDATRINPLSVRLAPAVVAFGETGGAFERHNRGHIERSKELDEKTSDADNDMVLHFRAAETGVAEGDTELCVKGTFRSGPDTFKFFGCDVVDVK